MAILGVTMTKDKPTRAMILKVQYRKSAEQLLAKRNATFKYTNDETIQPIKVIFANKKTRLFSDWKEIFEYFS